jgi:hypothetical protein
LGYVDPVTEEFSDGETQIWKITHNGVDAHPVHFHLLNVQVINRVGWDGTIKPPHSNEYGWKETLVMNPLEDVLVAVRAKKPATGGFGLPMSKRLRDPSQPAGVPMGFTQVNPLTGMPAVVVNQEDNFGWEYVWHCHILGHEENDFMRPIKFNANEAVPVAPSGLNYGSGAMTWVDNSKTEIKYQIYYVPNTMPASGTATLAQDNVLANSEKAVVTDAPAGSKLAVVAVGANGNSGALMGASALSAPAGLATEALGPNSARFTWAAVSNAAFYLPQISIDGGLSWANLPSTTTTSIDATGLTASTTYTFRVMASTASLMVNKAQLASVSPYAVSPSVTTWVALPGTPGITGVIAMAQTLKTAFDTATFTVVPPTTGGPVVSYTVQYSSSTNRPANNSTSWVTALPADVTLTGTQLAVQVPRGTPNTTRYWIRVAGTNTTGTGTYGAAVRSIATK